MDNGQMWATRPTCAVFSRSWAELSSGMHARGPVDPVLSTAAPTTGSSGWSRWATRGRVAHSS